MDRVQFTSVLLLKKKVIEHSILILVLALYGFKIFINDASSTPHQTIIMGF